MNTFLAWFARNGVAANLLMLVIVVAGLSVSTSLKQEVFPEVELDTITVSVLYPGASPEDVEQAICVRVEEAVDGLDGIKRLTSTASESVGVVSIEVETGYDVREVLDDVKSAVDGITTFPENAEEPEIRDLAIRRQVVDVAVSGEVDERTLRYFAEKVRDELASLPDISLVELANVPPHEISIEVSEASLREHGLSFTSVATAVRQSSLELPGGSVKTEAGEILLRTASQAYTGEDFAGIVLRTQPDGSRLYLGDVATILDGFEDTDQWTRFDGKPGALVQVFRVGEQSAIDVADAAKAYVAEAQARMPEGIDLTLWQDSTRVLKSRLELLQRNAIMGLALVLLILALFLRIKLAFWVSLGIPISFLGAVWMLPFLDLSINVISLFGFILVLGIVVDDAIVVGESVYARLRRGERGVRAAINGVQKIAVPVFFSVATTIAAFVPLTLVPGVQGKIWANIPLVVIAALIFSLIESLFILPAHLSHNEAIDPNKKSRGWNRFQDWFASGLEKLILRAYRPSLRLGLRWRYLTLSTGVALLFLTVAIIAGGWIKIVFFPQVEADNITAQVVMPFGTPSERTDEAIRRLEAATQTVRAEYESQGHSIFRHILTTIGSQPDRRGQGSNGSHLGQIAIELSPSEERPGISSEEVARRIREAAGAIPGAETVSFDSSLFNAGEAVNIEMTARDFTQLRAAADALKERLADFEGVFDISDSFQEGKDEITPQLNEEGEAIGLRQRDLAVQVRQGFYGEEIQRVQRGRDDVRVMVRYPESERRSVEDLLNMRIRTPDGREVPLEQVGTVAFGTGYASIKRVDRQRVINVTADVDRATVNANELNAKIVADVLPDILAGFPGVTWQPEGEQREQKEVLQSLATNTILAMFVVYALLAIPLKSYVQPFVIMSAIPFGVTGAVGGHLLLGLDLSLLSMTGLIALAGVVVNNSLVMVDYVNRMRREEGMSLMDAVTAAGVVRFRPILLTSLTTFFGLMPIILEKSLQAQFLIPMAVSLAFGVAFSTFITLVMVPAILLIVEDFGRIKTKIFGAGKHWEEDTEPLASAETAPTASHKADTEKLHPPITVTPSYTPTPPDDARN